MAAAGAFMQSVNRRIVIVGVLLLGTIILIIILTRPAKSPSPAVSTYTDPYSHETVTDVPGKAPDVYGSTTSTPIFLGFDKLIDQGMTYDKVGNLKTAFDNYSKTQKNTIKEVSIDVDHITTQHDNTQHNAPFLVSFKVRFNRQNDYQSKVEYHDLNDVRLYLYDNRGNLAYDSQVINDQVAE
jgi:hypothetical protein